MHPSHSHTSAFLTMGDCSSLLVNQVPFLSSLPVASMALSQLCCFTQEMQAWDPCTAVFGEEDKMSIPGMSKGEYLKLTAVLEEKRETKQKRKKRDKLQKTKSQQAPKPTQSFRIKHRRDDRRKFALTNHRCHPATDQLCSFCAQRACVHPR